jgi:hypothetical protein
MSKPRTTDLRSWLWRTALAGFQNIHPVPIVLDTERLVFSWQNWNGVHPRTHVRGVLWYGANESFHFGA